jgi:hypothetical protein
MARGLRRLPPRGARRHRPRISHLVVRPSKRRNIRLPSEDGVGQRADNEAQRPCEGTGRVQLRGGHRVRGHGHETDGARYMDGYGHGGCVVLVIRRSLSFFRGLVGVVGRAVAPSRFSARNWRDSRRGLRVLGWVTNWVTISAVCGHDGKCQWTPQPRSAPRSSCSRAYRFTLVMNRSPDGQPCRVRPVSLRRRAGR